LIQSSLLPNRTLSPWEAVRIVQDSGA
jgi:hypothetical protein